MKSFSIRGLMMVLIWGAAFCWGQTGSPRAADAGLQAPADGKISAPSADSKNDRQKALAEQTERLFTMATDLKAQVEKTNRNILSITVVRKAEEIESLARQMKVQAKKQ